MTLTDDDFLPSGSTPAVLMLQRLPLRCQVPSAKPPSESKTHDRMRLAAAAQPMTCVPAISIRSFTDTVNERTMKFLFLVHWQVVCTLSSSSSSTHSPIIHSSSLSFS